MKKKDKKTTKKTRSAPSNGELTFDELDVDGEANKKGRPATVDYESFVKLWVKAGSVNEVAKAFDIKTTSASAIANRLRKGGIKLKRFPRRGAQPIDVKKLNRIATGKAD
jgi:hypothetical protein